jgi:FKBP-type peptidyl-prolyl cis-trans isomerase
MGRRNRRNRHRGEDGDYNEEEDADSFEREWLRKRQKTAAHDDGPAAAAAPAPAPAPAAMPSSDEPDNAADKANGSGDSKIDMLRAKKQAQKQRRKEKKAAAAARRKEQETTLAEQQAQRNKDRAAKELKQKQQRNEKNNPKQQQHAFKTLRKGVQMRDLVAGKGPMVQHRKKCRVRYVLRSKSHISGKILDSSQNFAFRLGKGEVISGWDIGMESMKVGGVRRLIVPPEAGYGNKDIGAGRGAMLFFEIELLHVAP